MSLSKALGGLFSVCLLAGCSAKHSIEIVNLSSEPITEVAIKVGSANIYARSISPGHSVSDAYRFGGDSHFDIRATLSSGKQISASDGYITNGVQLSHRITVRDDGISVELVSAR